ncbi:hypothetical protein [Pseudovibrio sp. Ad26]|uniref:hypothetical protein n=1 Tax=Pseudovibrio sp. Ad26 TaxID=989410 RepID=UPI0007AE973B|nr:hypothetical protein [Pseudovibrio sp. Ad26]
MAAEWEIITNREQFRFFNHNEFISEKYYSFNNLSCSLSWNCETAIISAYLRTIGYCISVGILDSTSMIEYITPALPFGKPLSGVNPGKRPDFWPSFEDMHSSEAKLNGASLQHFLNGWSCSHEVPLFASGPILTGKHGIEADLDCVVVATENDLNQRELETLFEDANRGNARGLVKKAIPKGLGRWQAELYMRDLAEPNFKIEDRTHTLEPMDNKVSFIFDHEPVAHWKFWYEEWFPARLREFGPHIGVATYCSTDDLEKISDTVGSNLYLAVKLKVSHQKITSSDVQPSEYYASKKIYGVKVQA